MRVMVQVDTRMTSVAELAELEYRFPRADGESVEDYARRAWLDGDALFPDTDEPIGDLEVFVLARDGETWRAP
jgi:hypothetical protein